MSRSDYLALLVRSRPLYREMVREALSLLPPASDKLQPLESFAAVGTLAQKIGVSRTTASADLRRLENFGWVHLENDRRLLGRRDRQGVYLVADLAGEVATGELGVAAAVVRDILNTAPAASTAPRSAGPDGRGLARRWTQ